MKKILVSAALLLCAALLLTACGKTQAVKDVEALISAVGELKPESGEALSAARAAADALSAEEQKRVSNLKKLEKLEETFAAYEDVKQYLDTLNAVSERGEFAKDTPISALIERAEEIKAAYAALPEALRTTLSGAEEIDSRLPALTSFAENAQKGAVTYVKAFLAQYADQKPTVTAVYCSKQQGRDGEEMHFYALKYTDAAGEEHTVYSQARFSADVSVQILLTRPETFFSDTPPAGDNDPVTNGNVTLDTAAVLSAAQG